VPVRLRVWLLSVAVALTLIAGPRAYTVSITDSGLRSGPRTPDSAHRTPDSALCPVAQSSQSLAALINQCRQGSADAAVADFAAWPPDRVRPTSEAILSSNADAGTLAALVLLHTAAAIERGEFGRGNQPPHADLHYPAAVRAVRLLSARSTSDPRVRTFCSNWYVLASSMWCAGRHYVTAAQLLRGAKGQFDGDAEFLLAAGTAAEMLMGPYESEMEAMAAQSGSRAIPTAGGKWFSGGVLSSDRTDAEAWLRRAVSLSPGLVEARLRLGRVWCLTDRQADAIRELERVQQEGTQAGHPFASYLAATFLGQLHQHARRVDAARAAYEAAIAMQPWDRAARLSLGQMLVVTGRPDEGWAVVRGIAGAPSTGGDAWSEYRSGQFWQTFDRMSALAAWVRQ